MINELKQLGFEYYQAKIVEVLLKEKLDIRELSKKAGIPFGKIYSVIKLLREKNIVKETNTRPKLVYIENVSEIISKMIEEKKSKENFLFDNLRDIVISSENEKGKTTRFFEIGTSNEDNKKIQLRSFIEANEEVLQILNIYHKPKSNRANKTAWEKEIENAIKRGVIFRSIYPKEVKLPRILQNVNKKHPDKFQIRRFDTYFTRCDIIDGKKVLIKIVHEDPLQFAGVLFIENEKLAENLSKIFNEMWNQAEN